MKVIEVYVEHPVYEINQTFSYYCDFEVQVGMRVLVPFNHTELVGLVHAIHDASEASSDYDLKSVIRVIDEEILLNDEIRKLAKYMESTTIAPYMACVQAMLPTILKPKTSTNSAKMERVVTIISEKMAFTPKEQRCVDYIKSKDVCFYSDARKEFGNTVRQLVVKGAASEYLVEAKTKVGKDYADYQEPELSDEQKACINKIENNHGYRPYLLYGVTGAGKTEVYLQLAKQVIERGQSVIILVPEIGLTPQMVARVKGRFHDLVAIYHSKLNNQEKYSEYMRIKRGEVKVVVGTRSAIFMPFDNLGLIIVDEEHDKSYKQDSTPRYHARDIALWRGQYHNCPVVMASATPSFESYARASKNVYELLTLTKRINVRMPEIHLVNMKNELRRSNPYLLSKDLKTAMNEALSNGEQVILLFNRRGYAPQMECKSCHKVIKCPHCDISLSYHKEEKVVKCHYCDYVTPFISTCPVCGSNEGFNFGGVGIQKLEEELNRDFKDYKVLRMDRDTTARKDGHEAIIEAFGRHEADILIGTQMIAKGLDFPNVTVVGIVNADQGMNRPDFRSIEDTFGFLSQASGRSGRSSKQGKVFIQTYDEEHYMFNYLKKNDYHGFFVREMKFRHVGNYPPYCYMAAITTSDSSKEKAQNLAYAIHEYLLNKHIDGKVYNVTEETKVQDTYRYRILIKVKNNDMLEGILKDIVDEFKVKQKVRVKLYIDNNPLTV
ncbi:MAG: primosomal protein N' [Erysipelotrichales bacterium]|nr:primosomal protein N' [Erysipelotrichales bacterium]